jgi:hypothetical protein
MKFVSLYLKDFKRFLYFLVSMEPHEVDQGMSWTLFFFHLRLKDRKQHEFRIEFSI